MLTAAEEEFVHNVEVLGLPMRRAAELAGFPLQRVREPHIIQAREVRRQESLRRLTITKEDSARGILDAIDRARIIAEPATEIAGWKEINNMYGHNQAVKIDVQLNATVEVLQKQIKGISTSDLVKSLEAGNVIDGDFYQISP